MPPLAERNAASAIRARIADLVGDGGDREVALVARLVTSFLDRAPTLIGNLRTAVAAGDTADVEHWAHALVGAASNVGAAELAALAVELERNPSTAALAGVAALDTALVRARTEFATVIEELR